MTSQADEAEKRLKTTLSKAQERLAEAKAYADPIFTFEQIKVFVPMNNPALTWRYDPPHLVSDVATLVDCYAEASLCQGYRAGMLAQRIRTYIEDELLASGTVAAARMEKSHSPIRELDEWVGGLKDVRGKAAELLSDRRSSHYQGEGEHAKRAALKSASDGIKGP